MTQQKQPGKMVMRPVQKIVLLTLAFIIFVGCNQLYGTLPQTSLDYLPTADQRYTVDDIFPFDPHCSDIDTVAPGPEWHGLVVGRSTLQELLFALEQLGNYRKSEAFGDVERWAYLLQPGDFT
jgi:hypothetical protein